MQRTWAGFHYLLPLGEKDPGKYIPVEDIPVSDPLAFSSPNLPVATKETNAIVKVELAPDSDGEKKIYFSVNGFDFCVSADVSHEFLAKLLEATKRAC